jgi:hypothetical protein
VKRLSVYTLDMKTLAGFIQNKRQELKARRSFFKTSKLNLYRNTADIEKQIQERSQPTSNRRLVKLKISPKNIWIAVDIVVISHGKRGKNAMYCSYL